MLSTALCTQLACIWEATARKPGNVHRFIDFDDLNYLDFLVSAATIAPVIAAAPDRGIGRTVLEAIEATRRVVSTNTNLGIVLLFAPLAVPRTADALRREVEEVLERLDVQDSELVFAAIRAAEPGGLGGAAEEDVRDAPTRRLRDIMRLSAERDLVARQYANGFHEVFDGGVVILRNGIENGLSLEEAIVRCHLELMSAYPDTLIARKRGMAEAQEAAEQARRVLDTGWPGPAAAERTLAELDSWLRAAGHARNPGTTADLVTASLFVLLREDTIGATLRVPWQRGGLHERAL